ncbi:hypothetical protein QR98_0028470 [Sarcoptes scabiei]|uniref:Uncharacterized protein n=1 Tax=Sarcoptes scabiei TaxID=52283 RepID=A0A132A0D4_SARSC|nr:hypothetical protein QR98_0028470 [Sarcoptes scabiei]
MKDPNQTTLAAAEINDKEEDVADGEDEENDDNKTNDSQLLRRKNSEVDSKIELDLRQVSLNNRTNCGRNKRKNFRPRCITEGLEDSESINEKSIPINNFEEPISLHSSPTESLNESTRINNFIDCQESIHKTQNYSERPQIKSTLSNVIKSINQNRHFATILNSLQSSSTENDNFHNLLRLFGMNRDKSIHKSSPLPSSSAPLDQQWNRKFLKELYAVRNFSNAKQQSSTASIVSTG